MPELPEVETVIQSLTPLIIGKKFNQLEIFWPKALENTTPDQLYHQLVEQPILSIHRRAKYILIKFKTGYIQVHLRMTGKLLFSDDFPQDIRHVTAVVHFSNGGYLYFQDTRKFGRIGFYLTAEHLESRLGPEPLSEEFTVDWLESNLNSRMRQIKGLLLDQSFLAGLGNIYVDEALWFARIHPIMKSNEIPVEKIARLHTGIQQVLRDSIQFHGTTIFNFEFQGGEGGNFRSRLMVFGGKGLACKRCGESIRKTKVANRGTFYCPECQGSKMGL